MSDTKERKKEHEAMRERTITVKLSDEDCEKLVMKCGEHGLTVGELIENFIGDFVCDTCSNGSDESMYLEQWFESCDSGRFPEQTLLRHLLDGGYDPEEYLDCLDTMKTAMKEKEYFAKHPEEADEEEEQWLDACIEEWQEELEDMEEDWEPDEESKMEEERERIQKWVKEKRSFSMNKTNPIVSIDGMKEPFPERNPLR